MRTRKAHSFLHNIKVATPCTADWNAMEGDERTRYCGQCKLNVYNLSAMTTEEAEQLIMQQEGRLCMRMFRRKDGTLLTRDCPVGLAKLRRRLAAVYGAVLGFISLVATTFGVLDNSAVREEQGKILVAPQPRACTGHVMGDLALPIKTTTAK